MRIRLLIALIMGLVTAWVIACVAASLPMTKAMMVSGAAAAGPPTWTFRQWRTWARASNNYGPAFDAGYIAGYEGAKPHLVGVWSRMTRPPRKERYAEGDRSYKWWNETGIGWPLVSFVYGAEYDGRKRGAGNFEQSRWGRVELEVSGTDIVLPFAPWWPGFLCNGVLYGAGWALVLGVPRAMRRSRWHAKGLCIGCGYDLGAATTCPECGKAKEQRHERE